MIGMLWQDACNSAWIGSQSDPEDFLLWKTRKCGNCCSAFSPNLDGCIWREGSSEERSQNWLRHDKQECLCRTNRKAGETPALPNPV